MNPDASSLHCPNCGAAADPDAGRCPYCRARLATVSCPSCFTLGFAGAAFCHKCGARRTRSAGDEVPLPCPGCKKQLERRAGRPDRRSWSAPRATACGWMPRCSSSCVPSRTPRRRYSTIHATRWQARRCAGPLPPVRPLRANDEPGELREDFRDGHRRLPRPRRVSRRRRAARNRVVHSPGRPRARPHATAGGDPRRPSSDCATAN